MAKQTFTTGQVLTAAQMTSLQQTAMGGGSATAKTASYTLVAADAGATVIMNSASATTITVNTSLFSAGDTVFIQNLGAGVSTITPGTATVNTASSLALAQYESGNLYFTAASASIFSKADGAAAGGGGKVLQVVSTTNSTERLINADSMTDITGFTLSITPTSATSKVLVLYNLQAEMLRDSTANSCAISLVRAGNNIWNNGSLGNNLGNSAATTGGEIGVSGMLPIIYLDSPATTSATAYKVQAMLEFTANSANVKFNSAGNTSTFVLMEIGA